MIAVLHYARKQKTEAERPDEKEKLDDMFERHHDWDDMFDWDHDYDHDWDDAWDFD